MTTVRSTGIFSTVCIALCLFARVALSGQIHDPLQFPGDDFTIETARVATSSGEKEVSYRSYIHIPYVAKPVDADYQSLNVSVPVRIDHKEVDATNAPVLFSIGVGGYMSVRNAGASISGRGNPGNSIHDLALAAGFVVVTPGCRGRENQAPDGTYYGKAPAAIVDLKAAIRYIRYNDSSMPGNADWIVSNGCSAGGALSALLGASGGSSLYDEYLKDLGAAPAGDRILGTSCFSPITDLEHADMAYEWMYGSAPARNGLVDQDLSMQLKAAFTAYQASLDLQGKNGFGPVSAGNYDSYLLKYYLIPSAGMFLEALSPEERKAYLDSNSWLNWSGQEASFSFEDYVSHVGRMKGLPAFDDFEMRQPEPVLFGTSTANARHFTNFSLRYSSGNPNAEIDGELKQVLDLMNAMYFIRTDNPGCAPYWRVRNGSSDNHTSQTVCINLVTKLENLHKEVDAWLYWDGGHCANDDPENLITWISSITGYQGNSGDGK